MPGNFDSNPEQSLMRIADKLALIQKTLETQNELLRKLIERLNVEK